MSRIGLNRNSKVFVPQTRNHGSNKVNITTPNKSTTNITKPTTLNKSTTTPDKSATIPKPNTYIIPPVMVVSTSINVSVDTDRLLKLPELFYDAIDDCDDQKSLVYFNEYYELTGKCLHSSVTHLNPKTFLRYMELEPKPHLEDPKNYIYTFIANGDVECWNAYVPHLVPDTVELYYNNISNVQGAIQLSNMGYKDLNLEHAITNIQRLIRKKKPLHRINRKIIPSDFDNEDSSYLQWNPQCIPRIIRLASNNRNHFLLDLVSQSLGVNIPQMILDQKKRLIGKLSNDNDILSKILILINWYSDGNLMEKRHELRDQLKFIIITSSYVKLFEMIYNRLMMMTVKGVKDILSLIPIVKPDVSILSTFKELNLDTMRSVDLRTWFLRIVYQPYDKLNNTDRRLKKFIDYDVKTSRGKKQCINILKDRQELVRQGKPLTSLSFGSMPTSSKYIV